MSNTAIALQENVKTDDVRSRFSVHSAFALFKKDLQFVLLFISTHLIRIKTDRLLAPRKAFTIRA